MSGSGQSREYVSVEGVVACGKTCLAELLAQSLGWSPLLEETEVHPFIAEFYRQPDAFVFETELGFALIHYHQLHKAKRDGLFSKGVVADFMFAKDRLFADINLSGHELELFNTVFTYLNERVRQPSAIIYLKASTPFLMERIRARGRPMEKGIEPAYLDRLGAAYDGFFSSYGASPVITLDAEQHDFLSSQSDVQLVVDELDVLADASPTR
jgi:deoxyadenosine/deoxycytidine kinase